MQHRRDLKERSEKMAEYICECVLCHVRNIKRSEMVEEVDYIRKGTKYYHMKCYRDW